MAFSITLLIVIITAITSIMAFNNHDMWNKGVFYPALMNGHPKEWHRFISSGFLHADWMHLIFNMYVLYIFGKYIESMYMSISGSMYLFPAMYVLALIASSLPSYFKHKENYHYRALGASGAVAAVIFSFIYYNPWAMLYLFGIVPIPAILFGIGYLVYSAWAAKKGQDNIGHDAHFYGSVFGFLFTLIVDPSHGQTFVHQITHIPFF